MTASCSGKEGQERGTRQPSYAKLLELARQFNVTTDYLLGVKRDNP